MHSLIRKTRTGAALTRGRRRLVCHGSHHAAHVAAGVEAAQEDRPPSQAQPVGTRPCTRAGTAAAGGRGSSARRCKRACGACATGGCARRCARAPPPQSWRAQRRRWSCRPAASSSHGCAPDETDPVPLVRVQRLAARRRADERGGGGAWGAIAGAVRAPPNQYACVNNARCCACY